MVEDKAKNSLPQGVTMRSKDSPPAQPTHAESHMIFLLRRNERVLRSKEAVLRGKELLKQTRELIDRSMKMRCLNEPPWWRTDISLDGASYSASDAGSEPAHVAADRAIKMGREC